MTDQAARPPSPPEAITPTPSGAGAQEVQPPKRSSFRKDFLWVLVANVVFAASQLGLYMIMTRFTTDLAIGYYTWAASIAGMLILFTNLNLRGLLATDASEEFTFSQYLSLRLVMTSLATAVLLVVTIAAGYGLEALLVALAVGALRLVQSASDIFWGQFMQKLRMRWLATGKIMRSVLGITVAAFVIWATGSTALGIAVMASIRLSVLLFYEMPRSRKLDSWKLSFRRWRPLAKLAWMGLPLGASALAVSLSVYLPRFFIVAYQGEVALGQFGAISVFIAMVSMVTNALGQSAAPRLAQYYHSNLKAYVTFLLKLVALGLCIALTAVAGALLLGRPILSILYTPDYADLAPVFVWVIGASALNGVGVFFAAAITAARILRMQLVARILQNVILALLCWWLVPRYGLVGAAQALAAACAVNILSYALLTVWAIARRRHSVSSDASRLAD
jgi:O-antigen/teichoic acid export membrane protein